MTTRESFLLYKRFFGAIKGLPNEELGRLFRAIYTYQISGLEPTSTDTIYMAFMFFKNQFELDDEKYQKVVERNQKNGSQGGRGKTQSKRKNPLGSLASKKADNEKDNDNDNVKENDKDIYTYGEYVSFLNQTLGRKYTLKDKKASTSFACRLKDGWTKEQIELAVKNAAQDDYHRENKYKYLTPEFFTRTDKLDKFSQLFVMQEKKGDQPKFRNE